MVKKTKHESRGQRSETCDIIGCEEKGRKLANFGGVIPICYCPRHRKKYGERILTALVNSMFNYRLSNFLTNVKKDIFWKSGVISEETAVKLKEYVISKTVELEALEEFAGDNEVEVSEDDL